MSEYEEVQLEIAKQNNWAGNRNKTIKTKEISRSVQIKLY